jgi:hypothetical protein
MLTSEVNISPIVLKNAGVECGSLMRIYVRCATVYYWPFAAQCLLEHYQGLFSRIGGGDGRYRAGRGGRVGCRVYNLADGGGNGDRNR